MARILVCTDGSAQHAVGWAARNILTTPERELHILTVLPPASHLGPPAQPWHTVEAVATTPASERIANEEAEHAKDVQRDTVQLATRLGVDEKRIHCHTLRGDGGASGVAHSIVEFAHCQDAFMLVVGNRGLTAVQRGVFSLLGLGSVSDYLMKHAKLPVVIVPAPAAASAEDAAPQQAPRKICVASDDSHQSLEMLVWACRELLLPDVQLHLVTAELHTPFPGSHADDKPPATLESFEGHRVRVTLTTQYAEMLCRKARDIAVLSGANPDQIVTAALSVAGTLNEDKAKAIIAYANHQHVDMLVLGSRGLGALAAAGQWMLGLGSVSAYCVHHASCPVVVKRSTVDGQAVHSAPSQQ